MAVFSIIVFRQLVEDLNFVLGETGLGAVMACFSSFLLFLLARETCEGGEGTPVC